MSALRAPVGCDRCRGTGYRGRIGLFEIFRLNEEMHAEILSREIVDKGVGVEQQALRDLRAKLHTMWENRFNEACVTHEDPKLPGFHGQMMESIEYQHTGTLISILPASASAGK